MYFLKLLARLVVLVTLRTFGDLLLVTVNLRVGFATVEMNNKAKADLFRVGSFPIYLRKSEKAVRLYPERP